jgi:hypothetical protein
MMNTVTHDVNYPAIPWRHRRRVFSSIGALTALPAVMLRVRRACPLNGLDEFPPICHRND